MESRIRKFLTLIPVCIAILAGLCIRGLAETEAQQVEARLLAPPVIKTEPGFRAKILVPPGQLYDPLFVFMHNGAAWLTDDGGEVDGTGSRIVSVNGKGKVTVIVPYTLTVPMIAGGFAPSGFGKLTGQIIMFSQPKTDFDGAFMNHVIQQLDPAKNYAHTIVCTLPKAGELSNGVPGVGVDARFGPPNTPFGGRFFAATMLNGVVYQMDGAGECSAFADLGKYGGPAGIGFTSDGKQMLVSTQASTKGGLSISSLKLGGGMILRVGPDGKVDDQAFAKGFDAPTGLEVAPKGFGSFEGQVFVADMGPAVNIPVPMTQRLPADGKIYRVTSDGQPQLVASGFVNPAGIKFVGNKLWVTDIAGDFIGGKRELPDGFIVEIEASN
jgi:hypothetical protein